MNIATGFNLAVPIDEAWSALTDMERVAPCMPGVKVESADDEGLHATMRVKVGPVTTSYRTLIVIESLDEAGKTAVLRASGREIRGSSSVEATVTATLDEANGTTSVDLATDLAVTGKVAQLGSGVMNEVADRLLQQFAARLEQELTESKSTTGNATDGDVPDETGSAPSATKSDSEPEAADLGMIAGGVLLPRLIFASVLVLVIVLLVQRRR